MKSSWTKSWRSSAGRTLPVRSCWRFAARSAWKQDFADDEAGLLPPDLKRGVLSEDGVFDLLDEYREALSGKS